MEEIRQDALKALRRHKSGWIGLGKILFEINANGKWKEWGYEKFWDYAKEELGLSTMSAKEMMTAYEYIKTHEPSMLNILESKQDTYVPDYHTLATLSKAKDENRLGDEKVDKIRDTLFNANQDTAVTADREARGMMKSDKSGEEIMDDIKKKTAGIKKKVRRLDKEIHETSSFGPDVQETSEKLNELVEKVEI